MLPRRFAAFTLFQQNCCGAGTGHNVSKATMRIKRLAAKRYVGTAEQSPSNRRAIANERRTNGKRTVRGWLAGLTARLQRLRPSTICMAMLNSTANAPKVSNAADNTIVSLLA
ncbi:hypothetical protein BZM26_29790 [Paraburkholderia strydomiana]|nr:hypothetical protein BZM26_29790 [Paraburkholderia strydomiana]